MINYFIKILIILGYLLSGIVFSQVHYFNNRYDLNAPGIWDGGTNIIENDDCYIMCGTTGDINNFYWHRLGFIKLNKQGVKIWTKTLGSANAEYYFGNPGSMLIVDEMKIYTVGAKRTYTNDWVDDRGILILYNEDLDSIWSKTYGNYIDPIDTAFNFNQMFHTDNNQFAIIGTLMPYGQESRIYFICTDTAGNKLYQKIFGNGYYYFQGHSVIQTTDGGYAIGGYRFLIGPSQVDADPIIYKTDSLGNLEWEKNIGGELNDYHPMLALGNDGNIVVGTSICDSMITPSNPIRKTTIYKLDNEGTILWEKSYGLSQHLNNLHNIRITNNGEFIASGNLVTNFPHISGWLMKINNNGDSLWYRQYDNLLGDDSWNYLYDVIPTGDNGYAACGYVTPFSPDIGSQDAWVLKVDSMGCDTPGCFTTVINEEIFVNGEQRLRVWPNPTTNKFKVQSSEFVQRNPNGEVGGNKILRIYNSQGLKVEEIKVPDQVESLEVDVSKYTNGLYYIQYIHSNQIMETVKFIKN